MPIEKSFTSEGVLIAYAICFLGCYLAVSMCEQLRTSFLHGEQQYWHIRGFYLFAIGVSLGGIGKWAMHFIGLSVVTLSDADSNEKIIIGYNLGESVASLLSVIALMIIGVTIASYDRLFSKSKNEILELFIKDSKTLSMNQVKHMSGRQIIWMISTNEPWNIIVGGFLAGAGVSIAHFVNMNCMEFSKNIVIEWNIGMVAGSVIIAVFASIFAFWISFRLLSIFPLMEWLRTVSALLMAVAIGGMHFLGYEAASFKYKDEESMDKSTFTPDHLNADQLIPIVTAAMIVLWIFVIINLVDTRLVMMKYRQHLIKEHVKHNQGHDVTSVGSFLHQFSLHDEFLGKKKTGATISRQNSHIASPSHTNQIHPMTSQASNHDLVKDADARRPSKTAVDALPV